MACRRGCIMGGGQPRLTNVKKSVVRRDGIYAADKETVVKKCNENPMVLSLYDGFLKNREHKLLHNPMFCAK